jgi:hypothetical protein
MGYYKQLSYGITNSGRLRMIKSAQHTVVFHVDDLKSSHMDPKVNDDFAKWLEQTYEKHGKVEIR